MFSLCEASKNKNYSGDLINYTVIYIWLLNNLTHMEQHVADVCIQDVVVKAFFKGI